MNEIKVFQVTEDDWVAGRTLDECIAEHIKHYDDDDYDEDQFEDAHELSEEAMTRMTFSDDDGLKRSFREQLDKMIIEGYEFPQFFASTNF